MAAYKNKSSMTSSPIVEEKKGGGVGTISSNRAS